MTCSKEPLPRWQLSQIWTYVIVRTMAMHVFLDESGGLSFDFTKAGTTRFFIICLLVIPTTADYRSLTKAVERTVRNKLHKGHQPKRPTHELKGTKTDRAILEYFYRQAKQSTFGIYAIVLNKARVFEDLRKQQERLYNFVARALIEKCPFKEAQDRIILTLDKRKSAKEIEHFNQYLLAQLQGSLPLQIPFEIYHHHSFENKGLQAVDLFSWGIFRKYERGDPSWYNIFKKDGKLAYESAYLS